MSAFLKDIRNRKLVNWVLVYLAAAWGILQVLDFFATHFHWSDRVIPYATAVLLAGLLATIIIAWFHGEQGRQHVSRIEVALLSLTVIIGFSGLYAVRHPRGGNRAATDVAYKDIPELSVAVLPFTNMSGVKDNEYFSDGITEEISNALSKIDGLRVAGHASAFAARADSADPREIGRMLGVAHVLRGSVQRSGENARITAELIDTRSGFSQWVDKYDRSVSNIFAVEDEISRTIAEQLKTRIASGVVLASNSTGNSDAHDLYFLGLEQWNHRSISSLHKALDYFSKAVEKDSMYAQAWAGLALTDAVLPQYDTDAKHAEFDGKGIAAANRALRLTPDCPEAHAALSQIAEESNELATAEREAREAIRLRPSYSTGRQWLAEVLFLEGRSTEAVAQADTSVMMDPLAVSPVHMLAYIEASTGLTDASVRDYERAFAIEPGFDFGRRSAVEKMVMRGRYDVALHYALWDAPTRQDSADMRLTMKAFTDASLRPQAIRLLLDGRGLAGHPEPTNQAIGYLELLGARDQAVALARSLVDNPTHATHIRFRLMDPRLKSLREDPRMAVYRPGLDR